MALKVMNLKELFDYCDREQAYFLATMINWKYFDKNKALVHVKQKYDIDLERINNKGSFLDWIIHLNGKRWITAEALKEFIDAILIIKGRNW